MAKNKGMKTVDTVWQLVEPIVNKYQLSLWDIRFVKEGADWFLRVFIDKPHGVVSIDDCETISRAIDKPLDEIDPIEQGYCLEVSSPGLERELTRDEHFESNIGSAVLIKLIRPINDLGKEFSGKLKTATKTEITLVTSTGDEIIMNKKDLVWVKLDDFDI